MPGFGHFVRLWLFSNGGYNLFCILLFAIVVSPISLFIAASFLCALLFSCLLPIISVLGRSVFRFRIRRLLMQIGFTGSCILFFIACVRGKLSAPSSFGFDE